MKNLLFALFVASMASFAASAAEKPRLLARFDFEEGSGAYSDDPS